MWIWLIGLYVGLAIAAFLILWAICHVSGRSQRND